MTTLPLMCLLFLAASGPQGGLSTDRLDEYADQVKFARKSCGPTAVWYCLRQFGMDVQRADVCRDADLGPSGTNLQTLLDLCRARGLQATAIACDPIRVDTLPVPSIIVVDKTHCVVFQGIGADRQTVTYFEPAEGRILTAPRSKVERNWSGEAIVFDRPPLSVTTFSAVVALIAILMMMLAMMSVRYLGLW